MIRKYIHVVAMLVLTSVSLEAGAWTEKISQNKSVIGVQIVDHGGFIIEFDSPVASTCTANGGTSSVFFYSGQHYVTDAGIKALLSGALTALSSGMKVDIVYDDGDAYCWGRYLKLKRN